MSVVEWKCVCVWGEVTIYFAEGQIDFSWIAGFQL